MNGRRNDGRWGKRQRNYRDREEQTGLAKKSSFFLGTPARESRAGLWGLKGKGENLGGNGMDRGPVG